MTIRSARGFTLIELMIVVAIIGLLAGIAIPKFAELVQKAREASVKGKLGAVRSALSIYYADSEGLYPGDHWESLTEGGKYLDDVPSVALSPAHAELSTVENNDNLGMAAILMMDNGGWKYWNWSTPSMSGAVTRGTVWIGCTHTDTKGSTWSTY